MAPTPMDRRSAAIHPLAESTEMLGLKCDTERRWLAQVDADLPAILIDHAHCEKKAAGTAMNLIFAYGSLDADIARELADIVVEELEHFRLVLDLLDRRGIRFTSQPPGGYGRKLNELVRKGEPARAIDRLLVASLIEARSCERFALLRDHVPEPELAQFFGSLFESEARHHTTYVRMACHFAPEAEVRDRLAKLADEEARIIAAGDPLPRMHS